MFHYHFWWIKQLPSRKRLIIHWDACRIAVSYAKAVVQSKQHLFSKSQTQQCVIEVSVLLLSSSFVNTELRFCVICIVILFFFLAVVKISQNLIHSFSCFCFYHLNLGIHSLYKTRLQFSVVSNFSTKTTSRNCSLHSSHFISFSTSITHKS